MKKPKNTSVLRRLPVIASLAFAGVTAVAQAPAGTATNPTAALQCWQMVPFVCPAGTICGPGGGLGMGQVQGGALPSGVAVFGGAFSPLGADMPGTPRQINFNYQAADLRLLAPGNLRNINVTSATVTLYRGGQLIDTAVQQSSFVFAKGSLPSLQKVGQTPLSPTISSAVWLLAFDVKGNMPALLWPPGSVSKAASFRVGCNMPLTVLQLTTQQ